MMNLTAEAINAAWPKDGKFNAQDHKHIELAVGGQFFLIWRAFLNRPDLQLQLLAARPALAKGGTEAASWEFKTFCTAEMVTTHAECLCAPPQFALAMKAAMMGLQGNDESARAQLARVVPLFIKEKPAR